MSDSSDDMEHEHALLEAESESFVCNICRIHPCECDYVIHDRSGMRTATLPRLGHENLRLLDENNYLKKTNRDLKQDLDECIDGLMLFRKHINSQVSLFAHDVLSKLKTRKG